MCAWPWAEPWGHRVGHTWSCPQGTHRPGGEADSEAAQYDWHSDRRKHRVIQEARGVGGLPGGGGPSLKSG